MVKKCPQPHPTPPVKTEKPTSKVGSRAIRMHSIPGSNPTPERTPKMPNPFSMRLTANQLPSLSFHFEEVKKQKLEIKRREDARSIRVRRDKVYVPATAKEGLKTNLGPAIRWAPMLEKSRRDVVLRRFRQCLKAKCARTHEMLYRLSKILLNCVIRTSYVHVGTAPYVRCAPGYVKVWSQPSFFATRMLIYQILHCRTDSPIERICQVIMNYSGR